MKMPPGFEQCVTDTDFKEQAAQVAARIMLALKATFEAEIAKESATQDIPVAKVVAGYVGAHHMSTLILESLLANGVNRSTIGKTMELIGARCLEIYARDGSKLVSP